MSQSVDLWDIPPLAPLANEFKTSQHEMDPEKQIHSPELYAIWNAKSWMLLKTAEANVFKSKHFFWADIGAWQ